MSCGEGDPVCFYVKNKKKNSKQISHMAPGTLPLIETKFNVKMPIF